MDHLVCPTCNQRSMLEIEFAGSNLLMACLYCDLPQEEDGFAIYQNHCWNCGYGIDSRFSHPSPFPDMGYLCGYCGKDLTEWKLKTGQLTSSELLILKGAYKKCYSTVTNAAMNMAIQ